MTARSAGHRLVLLTLVASTVWACHLLVGVEDRSTGQPIAEIGDARALDASDATLDPAEAAPPPHDAADAADAADAGPACDLDREFGTPVSLGPSVNSLGPERGFALSSDELEIFFTRFRQNPQDFGIVSGVYRANRRSRDVPFEPAILVPEVDVRFATYPAISLSRNGLALYLVAGPTRKIWKAERLSRTAAFSPPTELVFPGWDPSKGLGAPFSTARGDLYLAAYIGSDVDVYFAAFDGTSFAMPTRLPGTVDTPSLEENWPVESADGLVLYYTRSVPGNLFDDLVESRRARTTDAFNAGRSLLSSVSRFKHAGAVSDDGCRLYLALSEADGGANYDLYVAQRPR